MISKLRSEFSIEGTAVGNEGTGFSDVTDESLLSGFELVGCLNPSDLVVGKRVDKLVCLVHLYLRVELSLQFSLKTVDL
jgi:hypothetical protein